MRNKKSIKDKEKILRRYYKSYNLFKRMSEEQIVEVNKTNKVKCKVEEQEFNFRCSSTDLMALVKVIRERNILIQ